MGVVEALKTVLFKKYATFSGRASRSEYWWFMLFNAVINLILLAIKKVCIFIYSLDPMEYLSVFSIVGLSVSFILLLPRISVTVRRLHDINASTWWCLMLVFSFIISLMHLAALNLSLAAVVLSGYLSTIINIEIFSNLISFVLMLFLIKKGTKGPNRFGSDPLYEKIDATVFS